MDKYREWPLGIPPKELQRKELDELENLVMIGKMLEML